MIDEVLHSEKKNVHFDQQLAPGSIKEAAAATTAILGDSLNLCKLCGDHLWLCFKERPTHAVAAYDWYVSVFACKIMIDNNNLLLFNLIPSRLRATEKMKLILTTVCIAFLMTTWALPHVTAVCSDCINHDITSQPNCREVQRSRTRDCRWHAGLSTNVDQTILSGEIVAYKIQWFSGRWSGWYVPGMNDIDHKYNTGARICSVPVRARSLRRVWSYFYDHTHKYIICS